MADWRSALTGPLKELAAKTDMDSAMRDAFIKLYGWADARFMVTACSAFVHFLIEKAESSGLLKS